MIGNPTGSVAGPAAWMPEATDRPEPPGAATWWGGGVGAAARHAGLLRDVLFKKDTDAKPGSHERQKADGVFYDIHSHDPGGCIKRQAEGIFHHEDNAVVGAELAVVFSSPTHIGD